MVRFLGTTVGCLYLVALSCLLNKCDPDSAADDDLENWRRLATLFTYHQISLLRYLRKLQIILNIAMVRHNLHEGSIKLPVPFPSLKVHFFSSALFLCVTFEHTPKDFINSWTRNTVNLCLLLSTMSSDVWTPPVIATIVYRVVMIIVSLAFIWKKYRRPRRQTDGEFMTIIPLHIDLLRDINRSLIEEQLVHVVIPTFNVPARRTRSANKFVPRRCTNTAPRPTPAPTVRQVLLTHMEDIVQTALGVGEDVEIDGESTISVAIDQPLEADIGLDIELGDMGLRHRSGDTSSATMKKTPRDLSVEEYA
jgi:hypothetical protein